MQQDHCRLSQCSALERELSPLWAQVALHGCPEYVAALSVDHVIHGATEKYLQRIKSPGPLDPFHELELKTLEAIARDNALPPGAWLRVDFDNVRHTCAFGPGYGQGIGIYVAASDPRLQGIYFIPLVEYPMEQCYPPRIEVAPSCGGVNP
jgi:hypothetical protein